LLSLRLRDRDAPLTKEGLIFRVYGYTHPPEAYICDVEYAPASIFKIQDPRAFRQNENGKQVYYKFFVDHGLQFVHELYPQYTIWYAPLQIGLVGVHINQITLIRRPDIALQKLLARQADDPLLEALETLVNTILERTELSATDFGVFGSLLHGFYHPQFSDIDLVVYGGDKLQMLRKILEILYNERPSRVRNEFENEETVKEKGARWKFINYSAKEYCWHQRRKAIYALFRDAKTGRVIKTEFEPVKQWGEIYNEYDPRTRILGKGFVKAVARITDDSEAPFMPSIYKVEIDHIMEGERADNIQRILSYMEEFRMQATRDEMVYVQGHLEEVISRTETFHQITLTYGPRYYEQVLKVAKSCL
jgi:predicted nucleotidyltransferase